MAKRGSHTMAIQKQKRAPNRFSTADDNSTVAIFMGDLGQWQKGLPHGKLGAK